MSAREKLIAAAARNAYLLSLLSFTEHEFPDDDQLINGEMVALEIQANLRVMQELLPQMSECAA